MAVLQSRCLLARGSGCLSEPRRISRRWCGDSGGMDACGNAARLSEPLFTFSSSSPVVLRFCSWDEAVHFTTTGQHSTTSLQVSPLPAQTQSAGRQCDGLIHFNAVARSPEKVHQFKMVSGLLLCILHLSLRGRTRSQSSCQLVSGIYFCFCMPWDISFATHGQPFLAAHV